MSSREFSSASPLKLGRLAQTLIDIIASIVILTFVTMAVLSVPLCIGLLLFANWN